MTIKELTQLILKQAEEKGWGTNAKKIIVAEKIALIHSEISEAFEGYRHKNINRRHGFKEEIGDALTRILHLCGVLDVDIEKAVLKKLKINKKRIWNRNKLNELSLRKIK